MKNIFDLVIRFMAISAMLVGVSLAVVATAPEAAAQNPEICNVIQGTNMNRVKRLLARGNIDLNARCSYYNDGEYTLLGLASDRQNMKVFNALLLAGADPTVKSKRFGRREPKQVSNIWFWVHEPHPDALQAVKILLNKGVSPGPGVFLHSYESMEMVNLFIEAGVPVDRTDSAGWTSLMHIAGRRDKDGYVYNGLLLRRLISLGANVNVKSTAPQLFSITEKPRPTGWTPLMNAALAFNRPAARVLLAAGADPHITSTEDKTAYDYAYSARHYRFNADSNMRRFFLQWYEDMEAKWKPKQQTSKAPISKEPIAKTPAKDKPDSGDKSEGNSDSKAKTPAKDKPNNGDKSESKVASPKKSESGVPSYGKAKDCADFVRTETPDTKNAILGLLKRNKISCYEVPSKCPEMLKDKSGEALRNASKALQIYGIFCYQ